MSEEEVDNRSIYDRVKAGVYKSTVEYPTPVAIPKIFYKNVRDLTKKDIASLPTITSTYDAAKAAYDEQKMAFRRSETEAYNRFRADLAAEYNLTDHPKEGLLYSIAYDMGHSSGMEEVVLFYDRLAELLK